MELDVYEAKWMTHMAQTDGHSARDFHQTKFFRQRKKMKSPCLDVETLRNASKLCKKWERNFVKNMLPKKENR